MVLTAKKIVLWKWPFPYFWYNCAQQNLLKIQLEIINRWIIDGAFPAREKIAYIKPTLKGNLDRNLKSYPPKELQIIPTNLIGVKKDRIRSTSSMKWSPKKKFRYCEITSRHTERTTRLKRLCFVGGSDTRPGAETWVIQRWSGPTV